MAHHPGKASRRGNDESPIQVTATLAKLQDKTHRTQGSKDSTEQSNANKGAHARLHMPGGQLDDKQRQDASNWVTAKTNNTNHLCQASAKLSAWQTCNASEAKS